MMSIALHRFEQALLRRAALRQGRALRLKTQADQKRASRLEALNFVRRSRRRVSCWLTRKGQHWVTQQDEKEERAQRRIQEKEARERMAQQRKRLNDILAQNVHRGPTNRSLSDRNRILVSIPDFDWQQDVVG
jgi:hypothetical protein